MRVAIIDENGLFVEDVIIKDETEMTSNMIATPCPGGFYWPKWDGITWVEGKTDVEIQAIQLESNNTAIKQALIETDAGMARIAEDIFDLLVADGKTFPQSVLDKIAERKALRAQLTE